MENEMKNTEKQVTKKRAPRAAAKTAGKPEAVKAPEKKSETKGAQASEWRTKNVEGLLDLNRMAWKVLHQLNAAIIGDSEKDLI